MDARAGETGADGSIIGDSLISIHGIKDNKRSWSTVTMKTWTDKAIHVRMWCADMETKRAIRTEEKGSETNSEVFRLFVYSLQMAWTFTFCQYTAEKIRGSSLLSSYNQLCQFGLINDSIIKIASTLYPLTTHLFWLICPTLEREGRENRCVSLF